jgi:hypothetical protein
LRRAYLGVAVVAVAFILFAVFVPFISEPLTGDVCTPNGAICNLTTSPSTVSLSYYVFHMGGVIFVNAYEFRMGD